MIIYPAIDLYDGKAVRLYKGDYEQMTVYSEDPLEIAGDFISQGATHMHIVDLQGARDGGTPNLETIKRIASETPLFIELGGGIRSIDVAEAYLTSGVDRVIIGTAAVTDPDFLNEAVRRFGSKIAVGADVKNGFVAIKGWMEKTELEVFDFCKKMAGIGVKAMICTDISKDGAMQGTNLEFYRELQNQLNINIIASGGVSSMADVLKLKDIGVHGAIIGKAYYTGAISIKEAIEAAK